MRECVQQGPAVAVDAVLRHDAPGKGTR
jgi:hypothetical protein